MLKGVNDRLNSERRLGIVRVSGLGWSPDVEELLSKNKTLGLILSTANEQTNE